MFPYRLQIRIFTLVDALAVWHNGYYLRFHQRKFLAGSSAKSKKFEIPPISENEYRNIINILKKNTVTLIKIN